MVELRCEAQRGSPPILYRFYREDNALGSSRVHSRGGTSFKLPLSAEHSGKYACEADNGLGARRSEMVSLNVTGELSLPTTAPPGADRAPNFPGGPGWRCHGAVCTMTSQQAPARTASIWEVWTLHFQEPAPSPCCVFPRSHPAATVTKNALM